MSEWLKKLRSEFEDKEYAHDYSDELLFAYIATQIKVLRKQFKWRQVDLAEHAGMKQEQISLLEDVNNESWKVSTLLKIARAYDLRLRVSFENFSTVLADMEQLSAENLTRIPREQDLGFSVPGETKSATIDAAYSQALQANTSQTERRPAFLGIKRVTVPPSTLSEPESHETPVYQPSAGDLAVSPKRFESAWQGIREKRAA